MSRVCGDCDSALASQWDAAGSFLRECCLRFLEQQSSLNCATLPKHKGQPQRTRSTHRRHARRGRRTQGPARRPQWDATRRRLVADSCLRCSLPPRQSFPLLLFVMSVAPIQPSAFSIKTAHGKFFKATPDGQLTVADQVQGWEQFTLEPVKAGEKVFHIKGAHGQFLCVEGETKVTANRPAAAQWESFELVPTAGACPFDGSFQGSLRSKHTNKFLSAQPDGHMEANRDAAGAWEMFTFHRVSTHHSPHARTHSPR